MQPLTKFIWTVEYVPMNELQEFKTLTWRRRRRGRRGMCLRCPPKTRTGGAEAAAEAARGGDGGRRRGGGARCAVWTGPAPRFNKSYM